MPDIRPGSAAPAADPSVTAPPEGLGAQVPAAPDANPPPDSERLWAPFRLEHFAEEGAERGTFSGWATVYGVTVDAFIPTVIEPGAFSDSIADAEAMRRVRILYQHDPERPIGRPLELRDDQRGIFIRGRISLTQDGRDALTLLRDGVVDEMSIGFSSEEWEMEAGRDRTEPLRRLTKASLKEVSIVTWGANAKAKILTVNSAARRRQADSWVAGALRDLQVVATMGLPGGAVEEARALRDVLTAELARHEQAAPAARTPAPDLWARTMQAEIEACEQMLGNIRRG